MTDAIYKKTKDRVERRLSKLSRWPIMHALLFTLFTVPLGLVSLLIPPVGSINGVVYWVVFFWSIALFLHIAYLFFQSGAWAQKRETYIKEELLDIGDSYDLIEAEYIALHLRISEEIEQQSQPFERLMINAFGNLLLWPGNLIAMLIVQRIVMNNADFALIFSGSLFLAVLGTLFLGLLLPVRAINPSTHQQLNALHRIYGYKPKRHTETLPETLPEAEGISDDGELILQRQEREGSTDLRM